MSFLEINNVKLSGVSACVPKEIDEVINYPFFQNGEAEKVIYTTGIERRHIADKTTTTSDLCFHAALKLIDDLKWQKEEIDCLLFVSQTPDYIVPATSCILQERLGLSQECYSADISLGCSGWVYGVSVISSLLQKGDFRKGLLLAGDTVLKINSSKDKSTYPLFGDAGTVTAFEYAPNSPGFKFHFGTDGSGFRSIIIPEGGQRNPFNEQTLIEREIASGIVRNGLHTVLDGMNVFSFGMTKAPETVNKLIEHYAIDRDRIDAFIFHQANLFMNEKIRKKLKIPQEKVPYSLKNFGNTSSATIPLTLVTEMQKELINEPQRLLACAFGVGLSWGSVYFEISNIVCPSLLEI